LRFLHSIGAALLCAVTPALSSCGTVQAEPYVPPQSAPAALELSGAVAALLARGRSGGTAASGELRAAALEIEALILTAPELEGRRDAAEPLRWRVLGYAADHPAHRERNERLIQEALARLTSIDSRPAPASDARPSNAPSKMHP
jgi:hypothetical protein